VRKPILPEAPRFPSAPWQPRFRFQHRDFRRFPSLFHADPEQEAACENRAFRYRRDLQKIFSHVFSLTGGFYWYYHPHRSISLQLPGSQFCEYGYRTGSVGRLAMQIYSWQKSRFLLRLMVACSLAAGIAVHGLSFTTFDYSNLKLSSNQIAGDGQVTVQVNVQNSGQRAGDEVVQLYVHDADATVKRPREQLAGFERVTLKPGEKKTVSFSLPAEQLSYWNSGKEAFVVNPGGVDAMVGSASDDIRQKARFQITTAGQWPPSELTTRVSLGN
jgi:hypothetical protein